MTNLGLRCSWIITAAAAIAAPPARAEALPAATSLVGCSAGTQSVQRPTECALPVGGNVAIASVTLFPSTGLYTSAYSPVGAGNRASATAGATYHFAVVGGSPGDVVPLLVAITLETSSSTPNSARAYGRAAFAFNTVAEGFFSGPQVCTYVPVCSTTVSSYTGTRLLHATVGATTEFINFTAESSVSGINADADQSASAWVDPTITIDPSFAQASLYSIVLSPGVGNAPAVPEPAGWQLMAAGLLAVLRRGRAGPRG